MKMLYFSAYWCAPCKVFKPIVEKVCNEKGLDFEVISVEDNAELTRQHNVKSVPTLIIIGKSGLEIFRTASAIPEAALCEILEGCSNA